VEFPALGLRLFDARGKFKAPGEELPMSSIQKHPIPTVKPSMAEGRAAAIDSFLVRWLKRIGSVLVEILLRW
jgi:hypothetical protein